MKGTEQNSTKVMFKRHAHLFTLISVVWTVFTLLALSSVSDLFTRLVIPFLRGNAIPPYTADWLALGICVLHLFFISLAIYFWRTERESVLMIQVDTQQPDE